MGIGRQARQEIDHPVDHAPMTSMFNLADVFELVVDVSINARLRNNSLSAKGAACSSSPCAAW